MRFALLSYGDEDAPGPQDATPGPGRHAMRFLPSTTSLTWRGGRALDGPVLSGRTQLLGVDVVECEGLGAALGLAAEVAEGDVRVRGVEVRPLGAEDVPTGG